MTPKLLRAAAALAACALTLPAAADAKPGKGRGEGHGNGQAKHVVVADRPVADRSILEEPVVTDPAPVETAPVPAPVELAPLPVAEPVAPVKQGKRHGQAKAKTFLFHGRVVAVDAEAGTVAVRVRKGNALGRRFRDAVVTFDLRSGAIAADEADGIAGITLGDVLAGDRVVVQARLPRTARPDGSVVAARRLVDLTERTEAPVLDAPVAAPVDEPVVVTPIIEPTPDPVVV